MDKSVIVLFAVEFLKIDTTVNEHELQHFIFIRPEIGKKLPIADIRAALEAGCETNVLEPVGEIEDVHTYKMKKKAVS